MPRCAQYSIDNTVWDYARLRSQEYDLTLHLYPGAISSADEP